MAALAQCDAFAFIYDQAGDPAPDILVVLKRVIDASGNPILLGPKTTLTDSAGSFHFTLPEFATAFISARASALWNCPDGRAFKVPLGPSGELVPDFSLPPSTLVEPPLVYVGDVLSIPKASATQDGYLSAADFVAFEAGAGDMGITQIDTGAGLTGGPITEAGTISLLPVSGVAGSWSNPTSITINAYGQIIAITATADTTAPNITAILATVTGTDVTITWTTDDLSDSQVDYGTTTGYGTSTTLDATLTQSHSVTITSLIASQGYHYVVKSRNTATLLRTSPDNTFTTGAVIDTTPPVITLGSPTLLTDTGVTINWTTGEAGDSQVDYSTDTSYSSSTTLDATMVTTHVVPITGLTASQLYHYRVKSKDAAGNPATPVTGTFTTAAPPGPALLTGLVSMWKLDETTGTRFDSQGTNHNDFTSSGVTSGTGKIGNCALYDGSAVFLSRANNTTLETGDIDYTIAFWVKFDDHLADKDVVCKNFGYLNDEYMIGFELSPSGKYRYTVGGGATFTYSTVNSPAAPVDGTWQLVVCWHDMNDGTINIQIGTGSTLSAVNSTVRLEPMFVGPVPLDIGIYNNAGAGLNQFKGSVDEIAFWKGRILTTAEIVALWNGGAGLPFSSWT